MNKKIGCVTLLLLLSGLMSCSSDIKQKEANQAEDADNFKTFKIDIEAPAVDLVDFIDEVEVMRLEETDNALLAMVAGIEITNDRILIPHGNGDLIFFSKTGEYQSTFNRQGQGPEEYERLGSVWAAANGIGIFDGTSIFQYDFDGKFLGSSKLSKNVNAVYPTPDGYALDVSGKVTNDSLQYNVILVDKALKPQVMLNPFEHFPPFGFRMAANAFSPYKNGLLYHAALSDTVFLLEGQKMAPLFNIDFGENWVWNDKSLIGNRPKAMRAIGERQTDVFAFAPFVDENFVLFNSRNINDYIMIHRTTSDYQRLKVSKKDGRNFQFMPIRWDDGRFLVSLSSAELNEFMEGLQGRQIKFREGTTLEEIESSENPVLLWIKFKELK
ncbi:hypothetical protein AWW67_17465 [Roseivirga seohaensis]|uniref:6-bladed beta-propeller n=1 Tax=Roseivirga seohaensis TaxID=1914963 RepID=A0A150Y1W6_9BACT|nr:6-bladed beta-propeller [Roseivirga seohaensis]KYG85029.1 hypothetical protein AWW67_17465 [Roseivirga seohaensis]